MLKAEKLGPDGNKVCRLCPLKGIPPYYTGKPSCSDKGIVQCNKIFGSVEFWRSQDHEGKPASNPGG